MGTIRQTGDESGGEIQQPSPEELASAASDPAQGVEQVAEEPAPVAASIEGPALPELGESVDLYTARDPYVPWNEEEPAAGTKFGPFRGNIVTVTDDSYFVDVHVEADEKPAWTVRTVGYKPGNGSSYWERPAGDSH